ncbi:GlxA family transcriptional regulator [Marinomonas mediterranea]|jgi:transcriptional regulator, AraC family with amidase-like domain|uniref:Transcriptional regulator, AraC family n=1 Tax=Marinomonas mediterranea (strain ATCC 700492 / JCM 21426 / NBRC 103028 / MMB-1) TaxID=717774 RepID=F2K0L8_MARM1|nr:GlxA family transcriptional regulator [Marinomonas mediterranea]ADZ91002.1 transcriptional regulator, AraC family [Marinomonas mediterranea MMB-1]WCN09039.1 helix-turn-helix domain-containing protein [Marinomonas mediterranea]WCN13072.1 helix-turn-helix domain-containing protein [Marinomonas mediterranea]WCN17142.1 helix-turn-helix domain-containing protein [Marinomonas mediterranea MMB-1]
MVAANDSVSFLGAKQSTTRVGFLLLDQFTMIALASSIGPLRMANQLSGEELYTWDVISETGEPVEASDGLSLAADYGFSNCPDFDMIIVAGGLNITRSYTKAQVRWIQQKAKKGIVVGGICTGAYMLSHAGLLDGYSCSVHWECMTALQENYPKVNCNNRLFSIENKRVTSSGGNAPLDMFLNIIARAHGAKLSSAVSDMLICDRIRSDQEQQRVPLRQYGNGGNFKPKLVDVIELMENNLEEPIELDELASFVSVSRRQLERMFHKYLDCSPSKYYLKLRLNRARQLLKQSNMSIVEISAACGFISTPHFSRCYRKHLGSSPRDERKMAWSIGAASSIGTTPESTVVYAAHATSALCNAQAEPSYGSVAI